MIDTDKYEGHTPTPWRLDADIDYNCDLRVGFTASHDGYSIGTLHTDKPTSQLIEDAPLLLAEVIRLREENKILAKYMDIVQKYDDALLADGDTDPRWSELYD